MMRRLARNVWVDGVQHRKGTVPPKDVAAQVTNPKAWDGRVAPSAPEETEPEPTGRPQEPPRGGPGSSAAAWRTFVTGQGVDVPDDASAKDIAALWDEHKTTLEG